MLNFAHPKRETCLDPGRGEPMLMRLKGDRYYLAKKFKEKDKGGKTVWRMRGFSLNAKKGEETRAAINLGRMLEQLERGWDPNRLKRPMAHFIDEYWEFFEKLPTKRSNEENRGRVKSIFSKHLIPFFGELKIEDITDETVKSFVRFREGETTRKSTLQKELRVLKDIIKLANPSFELPELEYSFKGKKQSRAMTLEEVLHVQKFVQGSSKFIGGTYEQIYQVLAWTAMDVKDAVFLKWNEVDLVNGWIRSERFKSGGSFGVPITRRLYAVFESLNKVRSIDGYLFPGINNKQVSTALNRAFKAAGLGQFSCKSLRHFVPSMMANAGMGRGDIKLILGHSESSRQTDVYIHAYPETIRKGFDLLDEGYSDIENKEVTIK